MRTFICHSNQHSKVIYVKSKNKYILSCLQPRRLWLGLTKELQSYLKLGIDDGGLAEL